jgi:DNA (cytosine-5)-methyltransferase 1
MAKIVAIDLFCGIGGLTHGLFNAGIDVRAGFDIDKTCMKSFSQKKNGRPIFINADIKTLKEEVFQNFFSDLSTGDYKMIAGCAPCQPYSAHQKNKDTISRSLHKSYGLILEYLRVVRSVNPHFVVMENVKELMKDPIFIDVFLKYFIDNNYFVDYKVVDMAKYGAPQRRKRLLFVAISKTIKNFNEFEIKESYGDGMKKTVFDAISGLPTIAAGETDLFDPLHRSSKLSDLNLKRIESSTEGGT